MKEYLMKKLDSKGFSAVEVVMVVVIVGLLGLVGWMFYKNHHKTTATKSTTSTTVTKASPTTATTTVATKDYKNATYGFSFSYPETWVLKEDLKDIGRDALEGDVTVTSPNKTVVHFGPNQGGKGGDCVDENDQRTKVNCSTFTVYETEKLPTSAGKPTYFYQASMTEPTRSGGKTKYYIDISNYESAATKGTTVGAFLYPYDEITTAKLGYVTVYVEGADDAKNNSVDFFKTAEAQEATPILKSFRLQ
jgi:hypothetical protein